MTPPKARTVAAWMALAALTPACALLSKSEPMTPRFFSPEAVESKTSEPVPPTGLEVRLGRVTADAYLKNRIMRRDSAYEITYYDERMWTEKPETYVRRALSRALFDERGARQVISGIATTLDVDVVAFEEVMKPAHVGRVELSYTLYDDRIVLLSRTVEVERPIAEAKGEAAADAVVEALAGAMSAAVDQVASAATAELRAEISAQTPDPKAEASGPKSDRSEAAAQRQAP
jgi:cholesterol transport system auxiliary component